MKLVNKHKYEFFHLKNLINKQLRYNHHLTIMKIHQSKEIPTVPSSLDYTRFPLPFFIMDEKFVQKQNEIIREYHKETIKLICAHVDEQLVVIEKRILEEKDKILKLSHIDLNNHSLDELIKILQSDEEQRLSKSFIINQRRAEKCKNTPFVASKNGNELPNVSFAPESRSVSRSNPRVNNVRYNKVNRRVSFSDCDEESVIEMGSLNHQSNKDITFRVSQNSREDSGIYLTNSLTNSKLDKYLSNQRNQNNLNDSTHIRTKRTQSYNFKEHRNLDYEQKLNTYNRKNTPKKFLQHTPNTKHRLSSLSAPRTSISTNKIRSDTMDNYEQRYQTNKDNVFKSKDRFAHSNSNSNNVQNQNFQTRPKKNKR
jgi:hypothetical protein